MTKEFGSLDKPSLKLSDQPSSLPDGHQAVRFDRGDKVEHRQVEASAQTDRLFSQEVQEIRQKGGAVTPEQLKQTAFRALDRLFGQASALEGSNEMSPEHSRFRADFSELGKSSGKSGNARDIFRDAEARALLPMIGDNRAGLFDDSQTASPLDKVPLKNINGSFFSQADLEKIAAGGSVEISLTARDLPGGRRQGRYIRLPGNGSDVDKVVALIGQNEGKANSINWNDNGAGISVGIQQSNQRGGNLPELLQRMHEANPQKFNQIFGANASRMLNENFVRNAHFSPRNDLGRAMVRAVNEPEFQRAQVTLVREHVQRAAEIARGLGIKSTMGVALVADLTNQFGEGGALKYLRQARGRHSEEAKITAIARASEGGHAHRRQRFNSIARSGIVSSQENFMA